MFSGNPGTGKTTVARIVARIYHSLGLLSSTTTVEVHRADLVAKFVGQTAPLVESVVSSALGGVLFIDEAYALATKSDQDFGAEAVATLVKLMEDHRDELAVIVAGYGNEMQAFIESNPGLRSRFQRWIAFPDYSDDELTQIIVRLANRYRIDCNDDIQAAVRVVIRSAPARDRNSNGRFARNLFEQMYANMARRVSADANVSNDEVAAGFALEDLAAISFGEVHE